MVLPKNRTPKDTENTANAEIERRYRGQIHFTPICLL
jgi:hypothetical protein